MQLLRVACVLSAVQAFVGTRANHVASPSRHRRDMNYGTQVAPRAARQPIALRGAPEDAADAKIDSYVKDNKVRVGVRGDARPPDHAIDATDAGHALHEGHEDLPAVRL